MAVQVTCPSDGGGNPGLTRLDLRSWRYPLEVMSKVKASYDTSELVELLADAAPPTDGDVSVTNDGRRLDTAEAVIAFFEEMKAERAESPGAG